MNTVIDAGRLDQRLEVLELRETEPSVWTWAPVRKVWGQVELDAGQRKNLFSSVGIGARSASLVLRRQKLTLHNALRWKGRHLFLTAILPRGRGHLTVEAALVVLSRCEDRYTETRFPAIMTEKYLGHQQLEPLAVNTLRHVLVTPKLIQLTPGKLVEVDGVRWPIQTAHLLDPHKNEYELERTEDL